MIWGKVAGGVVGFLIGGPLGAVLGVALGHTFDRGMSGMSQPRIGHRQRVQASFFRATFAVMGHLAKADGQVTEYEIHLAEAVMRQMRLTEPQRREAMRLFNEGKEADFDLDGVLHEFRAECRRRTTLLQMFMEIQLQAAYADGQMNAIEERILLHVCAVMRIPEARFRLLERMLRGEYRAHGQQRHGGAAGSGAMSIDDAYEILGVSSRASNDDVKKAYRKLMSEHHPDKLLSKGLPDEMVEVAKSKSQDIGRAYERIKEARGI